MKLAEIRLRDPFVLKDGDMYYMYGTRSETAWTNADGFDVYKSADAENWSEPSEIFHNNGDFWATKCYWAPECIKHGDNYYLLATFASESRKKGIQFLKSKSPDGIFEPVSELPVTPEDWECLDGTFFSDDDGTPYLIFSHSVPEEIAGAVCAARLSEDFSSLTEEPRVLFFAKDAPWAKPVPFAKEEFGTDEDSYFSDGPYIIKNGSSLSMLWSSWSGGGYSMGISRSENGTLFGKWLHSEKPIAEGGGHGMAFSLSDGRTMLAYHSPNDRLKEHPVFVPLKM